MPVALTTVEELSELLGALEYAGPDAKETDAPGFTGSKEGYAGNVQTLGYLFLRK